ncbi:MAG TPA: GNAT family N-acetyltransferase [Lysobacter sp.]|jgi:RimJ/RimL family protein N-acetyltransferase|nr:GNAT family N-acetyltransferase [Lysobacter sp.]
MTARERLPPWHERQTLANGRHVLIRPIRPEDAGPLQAGFGLLEPDAIRQRFLHTVKELSPDVAERLTHINPRNEFALVVAEPLPPGEALVGAVARVAVDDNGRDAEFAILVSRYIKNMGLGRYLMTRLVKWARGKKLHRLYGDVLENNTPMLSLAQSLGFQREFRQESPGLVRVTLDLKPPRSSRTPSDQRSSIHPFPER